MNLALVLSDAAAAHPTQPALLFDGASITYAELDERAAMVAGALLTDGVEPGDRVAIMQPNSPEFVATLFGTLRTGAIAVPLNVLLAPPEVEQRLQAAGARILLTEEPIGRAGCARSARGSPRSRRCSCSRREPRAVQKGRS